MFRFGERQSPASPPRLRNVGYGQAIALVEHIRFHIGHTHLVGVTHTTALNFTPSDEKTNSIEVIFLGFEAIVHIPNPLAHVNEQAGGLQGRSTGFHGKFIPLQNHRIWSCEPRCQRLEVISFKRCIDCARMYQPGFAVYMTLELITSTTL